MDFRALANSSFGVELATTLPRLLPPVIGRAIGAALADLAASRRHSVLVRTIRANQSIARGGQPTPAELDQIVRRVLRHRTRCVFDLYHNFYRPADLARLAPLTPQAERILDQYCRPQGAQGKGRSGVVIAVPHLSNYDLVMLVHAGRGLRAQTLVHPNPAPGYQRHYRLWASRGLEIIPSTPEAFRQVVAHLKAGGIVLAAIDRPVSSKTHMLSFFGRPSPLPVGHIRLALEAEVPVVPMAAQMLPDGTYVPKISDPIAMVRLPDYHETVRFNAEAVLSVVEQFVSQAPDQWLMFYPIWPDMQDAI